MTEDERLDAICDHAEAQVQRAATVVMLIAAIVITSLPRSIASETGNSERASLLSAVRSHSYSPARVTPKAAARPTASAYGPGPFHN